MVNNEFVAATGIACLVGVVAFDAHVMAHLVFVLAAFLYIILRLMASRRTASWFADVCTWIVPGIDLASNILQPPSLEKLDAFFSVRELCFLAILCFVLVLGGHGHYRGIVRANILLGASWASVWWSRGDARPLWFFVPLIVVPSCLAYKLMHLARSLRDEETGVVQARGRAAVSRAGRRCSHTEASPPLANSSLPAKPPPEAREGLASDIYALASAAPFQIAALAIGASWGLICVQSQKSSALSWEAAPVPATFTWPILATAYTATLSLYGGRVASKVWAAACVLAPSIGLLGALHIPTSAVQSNIDAGHTVGGLAAGAAASCFFGMVHGMQPLSALIKALLAALLVATHALIFHIVWSRTGDARLMTATLLYLVPFCFSFPLTLWLHSSEEFRSRLKVMRRQLEVLRREKSEAELKAALRSSPSNSSGSSVDFAPSVDERELRLNHDRVHALNALVAESMKQVHHQTPRVPPTPATASSAPVPVPVPVLRGPVPPGLSVELPARTAPRLSLELPTPRGVVSDGAAAIPAADNAFRADEQLLQDLLCDLPPEVHAKRILASELQLGNILGRGSFGTVHKALWNGRKVAVKLLHRHRLDSATLAQFRRSLALELALAPHENILRLFAWLAEPSACKVLELPLMPPWMMPSIALDCSRLPSIAHNSPVYS